jgi:hypothetical protein
MAAAAAILRRSIGMAGRCPAMLLRMAIAGFGVAMLITVLRRARRLARR